MEKVKKFMFRWWRCPVFKVWIAVDVTKEEIKILDEADKYFEEKLNEVRNGVEELRK